MSVPQIAFSPPTLEEKMDAAIAPVFKQFKADLQKILNQSK